MTLCPYWYRLSRGKKSIHTTNPRAVRFNPRSQSRDRGHPWDIPVRLDGSESGVLEVRQQIDADTLALANLPKVIQRLHAQPDFGRGSAEAAARRTAISGETAGLPLRTRERVTRPTPRCLARRRRSSRLRYSRMTSPGCGGLNIRMARSPFSDSPGNRRGWRLPPRAISRQRQRISVRRDGHWRGQGAWSGAASDRRRGWRCWS